MTPLSFPCIVVIINELKFTVTAKPIFNLHAPPKPLSITLHAESCCVLAGAASPPRRQRPGATPAPTQAAPAADDADADLTDECPEPNGYFADAYQCDKYYECRDGKITEKLCPDGMVFNDFSPEHEKCDLPFNIDCSKRPERRKSFLVGCSILKRRQLAKAAVMVLCNY